MLADDHMLLMEAFRKLLEPNCDVVGMVTDGLALLEAAPKLNPDIIVLDIAMPLLGGLEAGRQLRKSIPGVKLLFLTMNEDSDLAAEAMRDIGCGYILKTSAASELFQAIQAVLKGIRYVTPQVERGIQEAFIRHPKGLDHSKELTPRQREVLHLLAEGKSMKEAADILNVTARTIAFHKYRMMEYLGVRTTADLIQFAIKNKILVL
jgi:DNA-binding NarL/FixJ family response regulator